MQENLLKSTKNAEKKFNRVLLAVLIVIILLVACYETIGTSMIKAAYEGKSLQILNEAIKYQHKKPVAHYINLVDAFFYKALFAGLAAIGFCVILTLLVFLKNILKPIWIIIWGVFLISGIFFLNPNGRIFSVHGLMHSNIVYEIMHGNIPPQNPLLGGQPLLYPWGHYFLTAMISRSFNISPPWAFAAINVFSYIGIAYLIFKISRLLIKDSKANSFSIVVAIFCSTYITYTDRTLLRVHLNLFIEHRAAPIFYKLINANGVPIGFLFYIFFVYMLLRIFSDYKKWKLMLPLLLASVAGVGFFYFQMFAGLLGSFAIFFSVKVFQYLRNKNSENLRKIILTSIIVCLGTLIIIPYALSITSHAASRVDLLKPAFMWQDLSNFLLLSLPLVIIILANHKKLRKLNGQSLTNLTALFAGALLSYICIHFPLNNNYKFLIQSMALLGIIGGICISFMCTGKKRILVLLIMLLLARPFSSYAVSRLTQKYWTPTLGESDTAIVTTGQEAQLYEWILNNTSREDVFIDTELSIPCLGQRHLFVAMDKYRNDRPVIVPGYGMSIEEIFNNVNVYSRDILEYRYRIMRKIYDPVVPLNDEELREFFAKNDNLLIVIREQDLQNKFKADFKRVFRSSENDFAVFKYTGSNSDNREPL